jgi:hypothetical protein
MNFQRSNQRSGIAASRSAGSQGCSRTEAAGTDFSVHSAGEYCTRTCRVTGFTGYLIEPFGVLTRKYATGDTEKRGTQSEMMRQRIPDKDRTARVVDALEKVSKQAGRSKAQIALAWLRYRQVPVIPIIGARKISQLQDNIASLEVSLAAEQVALLDEASKIVLGFPHNLYAHEMVRTLVCGGLRDRIMA